MANKAIKKLLDQLQEASGEREGIEQLSDEESAEMTGGSDINVGCPPGPPPGCPDNMGCPTSPSPG